jgi:hypothetical protein
VEDLPVHPSRAAAALLGLEGLAGVVAGLGFAIAALVGHPSDRGVAVALGALLVVYGVGILLVGRGVWHGRRWARTPAYLIQFFALVIAWYQRGTLVGVTVAVGIVAVAAIAALTAALRTED